jgi:alpha-L-fucosidase
MEPTRDYTVEDTTACELQATRRGLQAFVDARFGMSVHWGLYSLEGRGEWVMHQEKIPFDVYRQRMGRFNPVRFNAAEWADLIAEAGQKFLLITAKHHDGFCMFDTQPTAFKVTNTPFGRDPIAELADALHERGLGLHFYYSLLDWTHPAYRNDWPAYVEYYQMQLRELLTHYGKIDGVLFDGYWPRYRFFGDTAHFAPGGPWDLAGTYDLIHTLQPDAVVANNHHVLPLKGEDYQVWELDMPGENTIGFNTTEIGNKPPDILVGHFTRAMARKATFMLNVGPTDLGEILPEEQAVLRRIGAWLRETDGAVYRDNPAFELQQGR